jgi:hypothetical protein
MNRNDNKSLFGSKQARLENPDAFGYFVVVVLELGGLALTTVAGFGAVTQSFLAKSTSAKKP